MKPIAQTQIQAFAHALLQNEKSAATQEKYIRAVEKLSVFLGGKDVTKAGVLEYRTFLLERLSAQTVNGYLSAVNAFLEFCGCPENRVKLLKVQRRLFLDEKRELSRQEYARLLETAREARKGAPLSAASHALRHRYPAWGNCALSPWKPCAEAGRRSASRTRRV